MKKLFFFLLIVCIISACSTSKINTSEEIFQEVSFGNYGGFSNISTTYILSGNGQLNKVDGDQSQILKHIKDKEIQKIKNQLQSIEFEKIRINELGNLTYFIKVKTSGYENTARWNDETQNIELKNTYKMLIEIL